MQIHCYFVQGHHGLGNKNKKEKKNKKKATLNYGPFFASEFRPGAGFPDAETFLFVSLQF